MLDIRFIRENPEKVKKGLQKKGVEIDIDELLRLDEERRRKNRESDTLRARQNALSDEVSRLKGGERETKIEEGKMLKTELARVSDEYNEADTAFWRLLRTIPNLPADTVPEGGVDDYVVLREVGEKPHFSFPHRDYIELGEQLDLIDTERAAKVSGTRFGYLKNEAPLLEFALVHLAMDFVRDEKNIRRVIEEEKLSLSASPFVPLVPPVLIRTEAMEAMGYVERGKEDIYFLPDDNLYLVGTSEQSVGSMHMDEILDEASLPRRYIAFSSCFRREAGSYGKDTRGILRVHQFDKVEMFVFSTPETSGDEHTLLLGIEERLMRALALPYRVIQIAAGDLGDPAAAKYDIEAWLPGQNDKKGQYRETHSTSNTTDFQARRLHTRVRRKDGKVEALHTLNGTAFAIGRMIIAILENYQQADGTIRIPNVLQKYMGGMEVIERTS